MPYRLLITNEDKTLFREGILTPEIKSKVEMLRFEIESDIKGGIQQKFTSDEEQGIYQAVLAQLVEAQKMLDEVEGSNKSECPALDSPEVDSNPESETGYTFERSIPSGVRHCITITDKQRPQIYWGIGVRHEGNILDQGNNVKITGYYLCTTPLSLQVFKQALYSTKRFFPCDQLPFWVEHRKKMDAEIPILELFKIQPLKQLFFSYLGYEKPKAEETVPIKRAALEGTVLECSASEGLAPEGESSAPKIADPKDPQAQNKIAVRIAPPGGL